MLNATAAIAVGIGLDVPVEQIREGLEQFNGVDRRFQLKGARTAFASSTTTAIILQKFKRDAGRRAGSVALSKVHVIFQPHRYTRTQLLFDDFATAFGDADSVFVLDIYRGQRVADPGRHR